MPTSHEIEEHQAKYGIRAIGIHPSAGSEPPLLGELVVVPFGDYANALKTEYEKGREDERMKHHANSCCYICKTHVNPHRGCILR